MAFNRPTLKTLIDRIAADIESRLPGANARLRRNLLTILGRAQAGAAHGLHGHLEYESRQLFADTADAEHLARIATIWGVTRKAAVAASGPVTFTGTDGSIIPAGTVLQRSDGTDYATDFDDAIEAGSATVTVTAVEAGASGNTETGSTLSLVAAIAGVDSQATVADPGVTGGADTEPDDELRARLIARIQQPPQGGSRADYERWALEITAVTRAWVYPHELGAGTVVVRIVTDDAPGGLIPDAATVQAVQDHINEKCPVKADARVFAPVAAPLNPTIQLEPNTAAVQAAVEAELQDLLRREAIPGGTIEWSHLNEAISIAAGEVDHVLVVPAADVAHAPSEIATLGVITWEAIA